jgi:CheY-like chemotaxis protein
MKKVNATLLIVDDNLDDQALMVRAFRKAGLTDPIHTVANGAEAISYMMGEGKYADRKKYAYPTFIITDLKMPAADGFAVLEFLKSNPAWKVIPTIVFSASRDLDDIRRSYVLGASSYHVKPSTLEELFNQLAILQAYWMTCEVPEVDSTGKQVETDSAGKLGERFAQTDVPAHGGPERKER